MQEFFQCQVAQINVRYFSVVGANWVDFKIAKFISKEVVCT